MNTTGDAATADDSSHPARDQEGVPVIEPTAAAEPSQPVQPAGRPEEPRRQASIGATMALVLALWLAIVLVLASVQILLNRHAGIDLAVGSLPGVWDWVLSLGMVVATWVLVRRRHPKARP